MILYSWNVNGIRAAVKKGFIDWLQNCGGDIVALQEVRANLDKIPAEINDLSWHKHFTQSYKPGYSGVGLLSKPKYEKIETLLCDDSFDREARVQFAYFGRLLVVNVYFPNGGGKNRDNSRIPFKLAFYKKLFADLVEKKKHGFRILVIGDFNTAHKEIDLARPKANEKTSGFCPQEREELDRWIESGWIDTFRAFNKEGGNYTWWSQIFKARSRNVGWRIDYILACEDAFKFISNAQIHAEVMGSDHCPISVTFDDNIMKY